MPLDAFTSRLGTEQGRVAHEGEFVFVLGSLRPESAHELRIGDFVELAQLADLSDVDLLRVRGELRMPAMPPELAWELSLRIDGAPRARVRGIPGRAREVSDLAAPVAALRGAHEVCLRLELVTR